MTGWEIIGVIGAAVMVLVFLAWVAWENPFVLVVLACSFAVSAVFVGFIALATGTWAP